MKLQTTASQSTYGKNKWKRCPLRSLAEWVSGRFYKGPTAFGPREQRENVPLTKFGRLGLGAILQRADCHLTQKNQGKRYPLRSLADWVLGRFYKGPTVLYRTDWIPRWVILTPPGGHFDHPGGVKNEVFLKSGG